MPKYEDHPLGDSFDDRVPGPALDREVEEKIFGKEIGQDVPNYSVYIPDAEMILSANLWPKEWMLEEAVIRKGNYRIVRRLPGKPVFIICHGESKAHAICKAALIAWVSGRG